MQIKMTNSILILLTIATLGWQETLCQTVPPVTNDVVCRPHILNQCRSLNYTTTLPNLRGQTIPSVIEEEFLQFEILFRYNCSNALLFLLCSVYAPFCEFNSSSNTSVVLQPCRNICNHVYDGCIGIFNEFQYQWPEILTCENFPQRGEEACFGPLDSSTIPYPTLVSPNATIPLPTTPDTTTSSPTDTTTSSPTDTITSSPTDTTTASPTDGNTSSPTTDTNSGYKT